MLLLRVRERHGTDLEQEVGNPDMAALAFFNPPPSSPIENFLETIPPFHVPYNSFYTSLTALQRHMIWLRRVAFVQSTTRM
jgi:hypothetical protein